MISRLSVAITALALPTIAYGQTAPAPAPQSTPAAPPAMVLPPPPAPAPLPQLTERQSATLRVWLSEGPNEGLGITAAQRAEVAKLNGDALVRATLDRARAIRTGRVDTADFLEIWALRPAAYDPLPSFTSALAADRLPQWINALAPPYAGYDGLKKALATYQAIRASGGWPALTAKSSPDAVRKRILIEDPQATGSMTELLQRTQRRYGLNPTGLLDTRTLAALNVPVADRIAAITANMERWRWLPAELPKHRVQVNIAAAVLTVFEGDRPVSSMRAVTGRPGNETPMLTSQIHSIVVNPPWNVPSSIAKAELWPMGRKALLAKGYKIVGSPPNERIVQPAGPNAALGFLKFDFDNPFAVYLHDTPARSKFSTYDRLASHGCVRLEKPVPLAQHMLRDDPKWAGDAVKQAIAAGKTQRVALPEKVAVYLLYWTAFANANGTVGFRDDPYGWDKLLASKIAAGSKKAEQTTRVAAANREAK